MKKIGHSLYLSGLSLFGLTSIYFLFKDYIFVNINIKDFTGTGSYLFILAVITSLILIVSGIFVIKSHENKHENIKTIL